MGHVMARYAIGAEQLGGGRFTRKHVLASVAAFETELRGERVRAGLDAARASGKRLGGGKAGRRVRVSPEKEQAAKPTGQRV